jgi:hypothetical protein
MLDIWTILIPTCRTVFATLSFLFKTGPSLSAALHADYGTPMYKRFGRRFFFIALGYIDSTWLAGKSLELIRHVHN